MIEKDPVEIAIENAKKLAKEVVKRIREHNAEWQSDLKAERADESPPRWLASSENEIGVADISYVLAELDVSDADKTSVLRNAEKFAQFCRTLAPQLKTRHHYTPGTISSASADIDCEVSEDTFLLMLDLYSVHNTCQNEAVRYEIMGTLSPTGYINRAEDLKTRVLDTLLVRQDQKWCLIVAADDVSRFLGSLG